MRPFDQLPVRPRAQDSQRTKPRNGKSGCARCRGAVFGPPRQHRLHLVELVQLDGSFHRWYEARGPQRCLITMVDDATSRSDGRFSGEETMWAAAAVLRRRIEQHGVPLALSTDWKTVYVRAATELEHAVGHVPLTQFGRMCAASAITGRTRIAS